MKQQEKKIMIDVGSSTVKVYLASDDKVVMVLSRSISFKKDFDPELGISVLAKNELYGLVDMIKSQYKDIRIKIFATALFRKLTVVARTAFVDEFYIRTGQYFNIIDQDLENFYLEQALTGKWISDDSVLLINIGGGSTELVVMKGKAVIERYNIEIGVGTILSQFPIINQPLSGVPIEDVKDFVKSKIPLLTNRVTRAFYTGGELGYMKLSGYSLNENDIFKDADHPLIISLEKFSSRNLDIFSKIKLEELESLMPENPGWMHGARGCSAIAEAICEACGVGVLIPSDSNLVNGAFRQEFRMVTISGSFRKHLNFIMEVKKAFEERGVEILSPRFEAPKNPGEEFVVFAGEEGVAPLELERYHLNSIARSDALIVCDPEGYVGASALIEIGYANTLGKKIVFVEKPAEFMLNTLPAEVGL